MDPTFASESWRSVLQRTRQVNRDGPGHHDLRPFGRAQAYRRTAGLPEPIVRARAFQAVLESAAIRVWPDERLVGSRTGFFADDLPTGVEHADYQQALAEHGARGQRDFWAGWDHTLADYPTLLAEGVDGLLARIAASAQYHHDPERRDTLEAMCITIEAFSDFIGRHAASLGGGDRTVDLRHIARRPPRSFHEAMQLIWLTHIAFVSEGRAHNALGRLDQVLWPFYRRDREAGVLTQDDALDLLCHLWARIEELGEVTNICIGGLTPEGKDATNELSYLCLEATRLVQSPHTNLSARLHDASPDAFHRACFECIRTGVGFPALFNDHVLLEGLVEIGIEPALARDYCMVGCIETMLAGRQPAWSDSRFNTPLYLLTALRKLGAQPAPTFERLLELFGQEVRDALTEHAAAVNRHIARFPPDRFPDPFLSALTQDCIGRALDVNDGGARVPRFHGVAVMGLATVADSLAAMRALVFEQDGVELVALLEALEADFEGQETMRQRLLHRAPKYGNAAPAVDALAAWVVRLVADECLRHPVYGGGRFVAAMAANVQNISAGREVGATPDGRNAGTPLSDAASPCFGRDLNGPTAFLRSVSVPDYHRVLTGTVINMKFEPRFFEGEQGARRFGAITRFMVAQRIPQLQFNFTGEQTLRDAQAHPDRYASLVVRVSGFSAYFTRLAPEVQADILRRRAHG